MEKSYLGKLTQHLNLIIMFSISDKVQNFQLEAGSHKQSQETKDVSLIFNIHTSYVAVQDLNIVLL